MREEKSLRMDIQNLGKRPVTCRKQGQTECRKSGNDAGASAVQGRQRPEASLRLQDRVVGTASPG